MSGQLPGGCPRGKGSVGAGGGDSLAGISRSGGAGVDHTATRTGAAAGGGGRVRGDLVGGPGCQPVQAESRLHGWGRATWSAGGDGEVGGYRAISRSAIEAGSER